MDSCIFHRASLHIVLFTLQLFHQLMIDKAQLIANRMCCIISSVKLNVSAVFTFLMGYHLSLKLKILNINQMAALNQFDLGKRQCSLLQVKEIQKD